MKNVVSLTFLLLSVSCASTAPELKAEPQAEPAAKPAPPPAAPALTKSGAPATKKVDVKDSYHGVEVVDSYRWLESADSAEVKSFTEAQNATARGFLDKIAGRDVLKARLKEILGAATVSYFAPAEVKGQLYAMKLQPPKQHPFLVVMPSADAPDKERVVLDPDVVDPTAKTTIDWFHVSPDGKKVAASLSSGGSETGNVHVFDTATGKQVDELVPGVNGPTAGGDLAWLPDSSGFYYSRYPRGDERPAADKNFFVQLYLHKLGTPTEKDTYEIGKDFVRIAEVFVVVNPGGLVLVTVQKGDGGEFEVHLKGKDGKWAQLARFEDRVVQAFFGEKNDLYLLSRKDAPRGKLLRAPIAGFDLQKAKVVIPEAGQTLISDPFDDGVLLIHGGRIYATYQLGGPSEIRTFDLDGKAKPGPKLLPVSSAGNLTPLGKADVLYSNVSFVEPNGWYSFAASGGATAKTRISTRTPVDLTGVTITREMATSKDGTQVPVNIILPKGQKPGSAIPFVVTGYGGYGVNIEPRFQARSSALLSLGVGMAVVNLRGGGEFGEDWHQAGALTRKQNVFDDFIAAVEHLVKQKHAGKVAITGGSNGGLLMGAVLTQRPELFTVAASFVGIYDMLRVETDPNGAFNIPEFGSVKDKAQFDALYAYSPFHQVKDGTAVPPTLFLTGANDGRVAPWHSRKMIARLQAASSSTSPLLLMTSFDAGHGIGASVDQLVEDTTDAYSFMLHHLGVPMAR
ncbi:MAG: peptidase [Myxococcaceae bacterium]|nr:peptidase [Myxococcaceae bacterium]